MIETNAILAVSSLDRYTTQNVDIFDILPDPLIIRNAPATKNFSLVGAYLNKSPYSNDFQITTPGVLTYGYISKIIISQIQMQYNIPTVNRGLNNTLYIEVTSPVRFISVIEIPTGFYTPQELASVTQRLLRNDVNLDEYEFSVVFYTETNEFAFTTRDGVIRFNFPSIQELINYFAPDDAGLENALKTYKLFGISIKNSNEDTPEYPYTSKTSQFSSVTPNFLYTPYIDIYSNALTAYQKLSDGNSTVGRPKGLIARVYLSGVGNIQTTSSSSALGDSPFVVTYDLNSPKVIKWTKDVAINSIDFQLRDCYEDLIPGVVQGFQTEFQMTLLCIEGEQEY